MSHGIETGGDDDDDDDDECSWKFDGAISDIVLLFFFDSFALREETS